MEKKLRQIIKHYGISNQLRKFNEETFELQEAIITYGDGSKVYFNDVNDEMLNHIAEEIADVMVMLKQFQYHYGIRDELVQVIMEEKIERQIGRIANESNRFIK